MERRARTRRKENSARASLSPVLRARVTSLYTLCCCSDFPTSLTTPSSSIVALPSPFSVVSLHNGFFRYISVLLRSDKTNFSISILIHTRLSTTEPVIQWIILKPRRFRSLRSESNSELGFVMRGQNELGTVCSLYFRFQQSFFAPLFKYFEE